jgi:hypothetical protein
MWLKAGKVSPICNLMRFLPYKMHVGQTGEKIAGAGPKMGGNFSSLLEITNKEK